MNDDEVLLGEREPLAIRAAVVAAVVVLLDVAVAFGLELSGEQYVALTSAIGLIATAVIVVWSRGKVTPVADPRVPAQFDGEDELEEEDPDLVWPDEPSEALLDDLLDDADRVVGDNG